MPTVPGTSFGLEVVPPSNNQGWVRQEFGGESTELQLVSAVSLQGIVHASDAKAPLPANVRIWRDSTVPGNLPIVLQAQTPDKERQTDDFIFWLQPGTYRLFTSPLAPHDETLPPILQKELKVEEHLKQNVVLDGADRSMEVVGKIQDAAGKPLPFTVQVRAQHADGWNRSTVGLTCSDNKATPCVCPDGNKANVCPGAFSFRLPFGVRTYSVIVEAASATANNTKIADDGQDPTAVPTLTCTKAVFGLVPSENKVVLEEPLRLPAFEKQVTREIVVLGGDGETPVAGAQVTLETELIVPKAPEIFESCKALYRRIGTTNSDGKVSLPLLPGDGSSNRVYTLKVISTTKSPFASYFDVKFEVSKQNDAPSTVWLKERPALHGVVYDAMGKPLADTAVEARGFSSHDEHLPATSASAQTNADGEFVLYVDPQVQFHLHFVPPASSGAPRFSYLSYLLDKDITGASFRAPEGVLLMGRILLPPSKDRLQPEGATSFTLNAYEAISIGQERHTSVLRATGITDAAGNYRLLVAKPEQSNQP